MNGRLRVVFAVTEVGSEAATGDLFTAMELGAALVQYFGWKVEYRPQGDAWYAMAEVDLVIAMVDDFNPREIHGSHAQLVKVAWARNWFERWCDREWFGDFDLHLASSQLSARYISGRLGRLAHILRIATNPRRFNIDGRLATPSFDYVFSGSYWGAERDVAMALGALPSELRGAIYGKNWDVHPQLEKLVKGFVRYDDLPDVYRQAAVVIDDANHVTKEWGAANSRVFDALVAGCLVITNSESVSKDVFDGELPVYRSPEELGQLISKYVYDHDSRLVLQVRLRNQVLAKHCYFHRAMALRLLLERYLTKERVGVDALALLARVRRKEHITHSALLDSDPSPNASLVPAKGSPFISFVVPLFNNLKETQGMLESLVASLPVNLDYEIILIDDFSADGTIQWLEQLQISRVRKVFNPRNVGYARSNNAGVRLARGEILGLLNNDLLFESGWLEPMLEILRSPDLNAGLVGNVQYRVADGAIDHAGIQLSANAQLCHIGTLPQSIATHAKSLATTGACMLLRKADFDALGGFDERYVNGCEDIDLCFQLRAAGKTIYVATTSHIRHYVSLSRAMTTLQNERNSQHLFERWRGAIKQELSKLWLKLLDAGPQTYESYICGEFTPTFLATPHAAGLVIAESILRRQEHHWARAFGAHVSNKNVADRCSSYGLRYIPSLDAYTVGGGAEFLISDLSSVCNFYICGRADVDLSKRPIAITITSNSIQKKTTILRVGCGFNVGIVNPVLLSGLSNSFRFEAYFLDERDQRIGDACVSIVITHIVVDDQLVNDF